KPTQFRPASRSSWGRSSPQMCETKALTRPSTPTVQPAALATSISAFETDAQLKATTANARALALVVLSNMKVSLSDAFSIRSVEHPARSTRPGLHKQLPAECRYRLLPSPARSKGGCRTKAVTAEEG